MAGHKHSESIGHVRRLPGQKKVPPGPTVGKWHAVSIEVHSLCCSQVRLLQNARFLSAQAPALPLSGCSSKQSCRCFYKHHGDRRAQLRRREEVTGLRSNIRVIEERRIARDRRQTDNW